MSERGKWRNRLIEGGGLVRNISWFSGVSQQLLPVQRGTAIGLALKEGKEDLLQLF